MIDTSPNLALLGPSVGITSLLLLNASTRSPRGNAPVEDKVYLEGKSLIMWPPGVSSLWSPNSSVKVIVTDTAPKLSGPRPAVCNDFFAAPNASVRSPFGDMPVKDDGFDFDVLVDFDVFIVEQG